METTPAGSMSAVPRPIMRRRSRRLQRRPYRGYLFRNNSTGDTWFESMNKGAFTGWHQIGGSDTHYAVVGEGDFFGNGTSDILLRDSASGDTWFEGMSNGSVNGWHQVGSSNTSYSVVGVGDLNDDGASDILFRNDATGDIWFEAMSNGALNAWQAMLLVAPWLPRN